MSEIKRTPTPGQLAHYARQSALAAAKREAASNTDVLELDEPEQVKQPTIRQVEKKPPTSKYDPKKRYHFQLINRDYESVKPRDKDTNEVMDNPFPPIWWFDPEGTAINPDGGEIEHYRHISGYSSIWVKDQMKPEPTQAQLSNPKNVPEFRNGSLFVMGVHTALLDVLTIRDEYDEVKDPLNIIPPKYRLVNPEKERQITRNLSDMRYEASKEAREATTEEMLPVAMYFGIDVDYPERDLDRIRDQFIARAESDPEAFHKQFIDPKTLYKYKITLALRANIINTTSIPGKMVLTATHRAFFDVKEDGDAAEQFAQMVYKRNDDAVKLYNQLENLLEK